MTVVDQIKLLDKKIMQNEAHDDLDRKAAKISALSSNKFNKYEYLTGEDLGLKPSTVEQQDLSIFHCLVFSKYLDKGLKDKGKKEGASKIPENIEDKSKKQLKAIEDQGNKQWNAIKNLNTDPKSSKMIFVF